MPRVAHSPHGRGRSAEVRGRSEHGVLHVRRFPQVERAEGVRDSSHCRIDDRHEHGRMADMSRMSGFGQVGGADAADVRGCGSSLVIRTGRPWGKRAVTEPLLLCTRRDHGLPFGPADVADVRPGPCIGIAACGIPLFANSYTVRHEGVRKRVNDHVGSDRKPPCEHPCRAVEPNAGNADGLLAV